MTADDDDDASARAALDDYDQLARRHPWTGPPPTLFIDSNVINEIYTFVDLDRAIESVVLTGGLVANAEQRRLRARDSLWMAMALDDEGVTTMALGREPLGFARRKAPPGTWGGDWVTLWLHFVHDYVCPGWTLTALNANAGGTSADDTLIATYCAQHALPLVSRDAGLVRKAERRGVRVKSPDDIGISRLTLFDARDRFFFRYDQYSLSYANKFASKEPEHWNDRLIKQCQALGNMRDVYEYIWSDDTSQWKFVIPECYPF